MFAKVMQKLREREVKVARKLRESYAKVVDRKKTYEVEFYSMARLAGTLSRRYLSQKLNQRNAVTRNGWSAMRLLRLHSTMWA